MSEPSARVLLHLKCSPFCFPARPLTADGKQVSVVAWRPEHFALFDVEEDAFNEGYEFAELPVFVGFFDDLASFVANELFYSNLSPDCWTLPGCSGRGRIAGITPSGVYSVEP